VHVSQGDAACTTSGKERRKSWQSYTRLKQASAAAASFRPRTLATTTSQSCTTTLLTTTTAIAGTSPPPATDDAPQTHAAVTATLSPIASGSSSVSYAPKSSASTCGGTTVGAGGVGITPDESADGLVSNAFLLEVDQQLQRINSYVCTLRLAVSLFVSLSLCLGLCLRFYTYSHVCRRLVLFIHVPLKQNSIDRVVGTKSNLNEYSSSVTVIFCIFFLGGEGAELVVCVASPINSQLASSYGSG